MIFRNWGEIGTIILLSNFTGKDRSLKFSSTSSSGSKYEISIFILSLYFYFITVYYNLDSDPMAGNFLVEIQHFAAAALANLVQRAAKCG